MLLDDLRVRLTEASAHAIAAREELMPRDADGAAARPVDAPPDAVPRLGAVLLLLYPHDDELYLPLTVRTASLRHHSGEVSLPGGGFDPEDETLEQTALREAWEELGITPDQVEIVAALSPVWIPVSNFRITPFVGYMPERPAFVLATSEVAEVIEVPVRAVSRRGVIQRETRRIRGRELHVPHFVLGEHKVWGATALVLAEFLARLDVLAPD